MRPALLVLIAVQLAGIGVAASAGVSALAKRTSQPKAVSPAAAAKKCRARFVHGVIAGKHKCLRPGQFCTRRLDRQYHRYGFHCHGERLRR